MEQELRAISVDDDKASLLLIERMGREIGLPVVSFTEPLEALGFLQTNPVDLVFVDSTIAEIDGIRFIRNVRARHADLPIVIVTGVTDLEDMRIKALEAGVTEFLSKPLCLSEFSARVKCLIQLRKGQLFYKEWAQLLQKEIEKATRKTVEREIEAIVAIGKLAEHGDPGVVNHISRVANFAKIIARAAGEKGFQQDLLFMSSALHDVGMLSVPEALTKKRGPLTPEEFATIKEHTTIGYQIMRDSASPYIQTGSTIALTHHERFDGSGYPKGIRGEEIPLFGRISAIADVFDALISRRPYKEPWTAERAFAYIDSQKGAQFDPRMASHFLSERQSILEVCDSYRDPA